MTVTQWFTVVKKECTDLNYPIFTRRAKQWTLRRSSKVDEIIIAAGTGVQTSSTFNMQGFDGVMFIAELGAGEPVAAAGHIRIENGVVKLVNNNSGHYAPEDYYLEQADKRLRELGVDTAGVVRRFQ